MATSIKCTATAEETGDIVPYEGALQLETLSAFGNDSRKWTKGGPKATALAWMHDQCSNKSLFQLYTGDRSRLSFFEKQTYHQWKSIFEFERFSHPLRTRRRTILILPLTYPTTTRGYSHTHISPAVLKHLSNFCGTFFSGMTFKIGAPVDLSEIKKHLSKRVHKDTNREQFLVGDILQYLRSNHLNAYYCVIGITVVDLYPGPQWNFVLGEASMQLGCGVFSFGRYFNSSVGLGGGSGSEGVNLGGGNGGVVSGCGDRMSLGGNVEDDQIRNLWVLIKVMPHELCHIFGLAHCHYFKCLMNESSSINEAITQPLFLCPVCLRKMYKALRGFDLLQRQKKMLDSLETIMAAVCEVVDAEKLGVKNRGQVGVKNDEKLGGGDLQQLEAGNAGVKVREEVGRESVQELGFENVKLDAIEVVKERREQPMATEVCVEKSAGLDLSDRCDTIETVNDSTSIVYHDDHLSRFHKAVGWLKKAIANLSSKVD